MDGAEARGQGLVSPTVLLTGAQGSTAHMGQHRLYEADRAGEGGERI